MTDGHVHIPTNTVRSFTSSDVSDGYSVLRADTGRGVGAGQIWVSWCHRCHRRHRCTRCYGGRQYRQYPGGNTPGESILNRRDIESEDIVTDKLPKLSKRDIERFAVGIAARTTSHGTKLDPGALAERFWEAGQRCILCRNPSYVWGAYIPGTEADPVTHTGLSESQARLFVYGLCVGCYQAGDAPARAEETIADSMLKEANARAALDAAGTAYTNGALPDGTRLVHLGKEV